MPHHPVIFCTGTVLNEIKFDEIKYIDPSHVMYVFRTAIPEGAYQENKRRTVISAIFSLVVWTGWI